MTILTAILTLLLLALIFGAILGYAAIRFKTEGNPLVESIDNLLPQTQCGQCGYPGCRPYAAAIVAGDAINKCPPGGMPTVEALADLLDLPVLALDAEHPEVEQNRIAVIREDECIGCTKCIQACPVDAILGAAKLMHTVIESECTGCDLCLEPCPVDCIDMISQPVTITLWGWKSPTDKNQIIVTDKQGAAK